MPSKRERAKAKAKAKKDANPINNSGALSIKDTKKMSIPELKIHVASRNNKNLISVVDNFINCDFVCCRHGFTDPISHRCERFMNGVLEIFKEEIITPDMVSVPDHKKRTDINLMDCASAFHEKIHEKKLCYVSADDFGYEEQRWQISFLSALGAELVIQDMGEISYIVLGVQISSIESNLYNKTNHASMIDTLNAANKLKEVSIAHFAKKVSCDCLKNKFNLKDIKKVATTAKCNNCEKEMSTKKLSFCSRCNSVQYCSKDCQVAHWGDHKPRCDSLKKTVKNLKKASQGRDELIMEDIKYEYVNGKTVPVSSTFRDRNDNEKAGERGAFKAQLVTGEIVTLAEGEAGEKLAKAYTNPQFVAAMDMIRDNKKVGDAIMECIGNPDAVTKYEKDHDVGPVLQMFRDNGMMAEG